MNKKLRATLGIVGAVGLSAIGVLGIGGTANAATVSTPPSNCPTYSFCLFAGGNFDGWIYTNTGNVSALPASVNDASDSLFNHGGSQNVYIYQNTNYGGYRGFVQRGYGITYLGQSPMGDSGLHWSNRISGFQWTTATS